jgi:hypothetical protein
VLSEALRFVAESGQLITRLGDPIYHPIAPSTLRGWAELSADSAASNTDNLKPAGLNH